MVIGDVDWAFASFLVFVRIGGMIATAPFFSLNAFPIRIKVLTAIVLSIAMVPLLPEQMEGLESLRRVQLVAAIIKEFITGVAIGFAGQIILGAIQFAAELMSVNIGLAFASLLDPVNQIQQSVLGQLFMMLGLLVFLQVDGHHYYIMMLVHSFEWIPLNGAEFTGISDIFLKMAMTLFVSGLQLAMPFLLFLFILDITFAIFARIMPQANIFFISLPLKVGVGLILILIVLPFVPQALGTLFEGLWIYMEELILTLSPR